MELLPDHLDPLATPIILMTSYGNERIAVEALKSGALDYVVKSPESMLDMPHLAERAIGQWVARAERIHMQKALLDSEAQFRLLAENASDMIARLTTSGQMLYVSPACQTILGYTPEELMGTNSFDIIHEEDRQNVKELFTGKLSDATATQPSPTAHCTKTEVTSGWKLQKRPSSTFNLVRSSKCIVHPATLPKERKPKKPCRMRTKIYRKLIKGPSKAGSAHWTYATVKQKDTHNA